MYRIFIIILLSFFTGVSGYSSGNHPGNKNPFLAKPVESHISPGIKLKVKEGEITASTRRFLKEYLPEFQNTENGLALQYSKESPVGHHLSFQQTYRELPVFGAVAKINISGNHDVLSVLYRVVSTREWHIKPVLKGSYQGWIREKLEFNGKVNSRPVVYTNGENGQFAIQARLMDPKTQDYREVVVDTNGKILYQRDLRQYLAGPDTTLKAYVFFPDPLTTAQKKKYGGAYADHNNRDTFALNNERKMAEVTVFNSANDTFLLEGPFVKIFDNSSPSNTIPETVTEFNYKRGNPHFEAVNAYYHISAFQEHIQMLGFESMGNYQIRVDPHALQGQDNSQFLERSKDQGYLIFGDGGVDDAEDADVVIHEYSHAVSYNAAPGSHEGGPETGTLEEGLCDYFACSYSRYLHEFDWKKLFNWDGSGEFWNGRSCVTNKKYPGDIRGNIYDDAEVWAGTLMKIWGELGRDTTDKLMLAALMSFEKGMKISQAAELFLQADSLMYGKSHYPVIKKYFSETGFTEEDQNKNGVKDSSSVEEGIVQLVDIVVKKDRIVTTFDKERKYARGILKGVAGSHIQELVEKSTAEMVFPLPPDLSNGVYIFILETELESKVVKFAVLK